MPEEDLPGGWGAGRTKFLLNRARGSEDRADARSGITVPVTVVELPSPG